MSKKDYEKKWFSTSNPAIREMLNCLMQSRTLSRILTKSRMFLLYDGSGWLNNFSLFQDFSAWTLNTNSQSTTTIQSKRAHLCESCENVLFASIISSRLIFLSTSGPSNLNPLPTPTHPPPYPTCWPQSSARETRTSKVCVFSEIELWSSSFLNIPA